MPPAGCLLSPSPLSLEVCKQQLHSICQARGLGRSDGSPTWLCRETFVGLLKTQVPGPHSR